LSGSIFNAIYNSAGPSAWQTADFVRYRDGALGIDALARNFLLQAAQVQALSVIGLALIAVLILAPLLDRLADHFRLSNRDIGLYRAGWFVLALTLFFAAYAHWSIPTSGADAETWIAVEASFLGILGVVMAERIWSFLRHASATAKAALDRNQATSWALPLLLVILVPAFLWGVSHLSTHWLAALILGIFGALGVGIPKGPQQAEEAKQVEISSVFE
jgi:hypothetical protein